MLIIVNQLGVPSEKVDQILDKHGLSGKYGLITYAETADVVRALTSLRAGDEDRQHAVLFIGDYSKAAISLRQELRELSEQRSIPFLDGSSGN